MANEFIEGFSDEMDIDVSVEQEMDYARKYFIANAAMTSSYVEYFHKRNAKLEQSMKQVECGTNDDDERHTSLSSPDDALRKLRQVKKNEGGWK